ncbi:hypothetical protein DL238_13590 [Alteriqipengyuania lutimaris]|uniref:Peptidase M28 domain-containing protein n=2 Tax=Alteriqipengyuania lutimaris TaxID=1538146 RepID=A0A395LGI6_9SPHN|nr:M28 family peptidase [Alteriqipengyuania lutimaris]RDS75731.1 hypothetical protein DL238_13590 [Alteriqipengyuania lutimaris]
MQAGAITRSALAGLSALLLLGGCVTAPPPVARGPSLDEVEATLARDITQLSDDSFAGRKPGAPGGEKTQGWLIDRFAAIGLEPAVGEGDWTQDFTLVRRTPEGASVQVTRGERSTTLGEGVVAAHEGFAQVDLADLPLVGIDPELEALAPNSMANRALVLSASDLPRHRAQVDGANAKAVVITTADATEFERTKGLFARGRWHLESDRSGAAYLLLSPEDSTRLMARIGANADRSPDGLGVISYDTILDAAIRQQTERIETANIVGRARGTVDDAGAVLILAHWDHLGEACASPDSPDRLCNGAVDNASGIAVMLESVRLALAEGPLDRDLIVLATSAEELGLLGAEAFAADPVVPLPTIVAGFNLDTVAIAPRGTPVVVLGAGETPLDYGISEVARIRGREVVASDFQDQFLRRQDGWVFLREGVPTVLVGSALADKEAFESFMGEDYHRPTDDTADPIELGGAAEDTLLHAALLRYFGSLRTYPGAR